MYDTYHITLSEYPAAYEDYWSIEHDTV